MAGRLPWACYQHGARLGLCSSRLAAQRLVERPWRPGNASVINIRTGETWERRAGSWFKMQDRWPVKERSPLATAGASPAALPGALSGKARI